MYVRYEAEAVRHAYRVAAGLDSMVVGETQVLGQLREAYASARDADAVGPLLHEVMQRALRVGKRAHAETGLDRAGASVVTAGVALAVDAIGADLRGRKALVLGAGSMGALAVATLTRDGAETLLANRNAHRARHTAGLHGATPVALADVPALLGQIDLVVCATAAREPVLRPKDIPPDHRLVIVDLAIPRDVDPAVGDLAGVTLINLDTLAAHPGAGAAEADRLAAEDIIAAELEAFLAWRNGSAVAPTVAALRARADQVVTNELRRLRQRRPELTDAQRADVAQALHRVVQQLLHRPSVRVRELAAEPGGAQYTELLRDLFDLDLAASYSGEFVEGGNP
jgi:glutamyl-tRNA reductase